MAWLINVKYWYDILKISRYYDNIIRWGWIYYSIIQRTLCTWREGIMHKYSILYIPQQNDVAKIRNHSLLNIVRSMKTHATLPPYLWGEPLSTAQYISNRIPSKYIPKTPYELWTSVKLRLEYTKVWECLVHFLLPPQERYKLQEKNKEKSALHFLPKSF